MPCPPPGAGVPRGTRPAVPAQPGYPAPRCEEPQPGAQRVGQCAEWASVARAHALLPPAHMHRLASPAADPPTHPTLLRMQSSLTSISRQSFATSTSRRCSARRSSSPTTQAHPPTPAGCRPSCCEQSTRWLPPTATASHWVRVYVEGAASVKGGRLGQRLLVHNPTSAATCPWEATVGRGMRLAADPGDHLPTELAPQCCGSC